MRRPMLLATAALAALSTLAACDRGAESTPASDAAEPAAAGAATEPATAGALPAAGTAAGFLQRAALIDLFETQTSQLALERTQNADLRRYAQMMIDDHARTTQEVQAQAAAQRVVIEPVARLDEPRQAMLNDLRDARPEDFDRRYAEQQIEAHENALQLMREYADTGDNPVLKDWARRTAPVIENHLQMARALERGSADAAAQTSGARP